MKENNIEDISRVGLYGVTYKEDVDDTRESPNTSIITKTKNDYEANSIKIYDPFIRELHWGKSIFRF